MHVLLICDAYPPEVRSASLLTFDFASALTERGHRVTVVTTYPQYNLAAGAARDYPLDTTENGVRVIRLRTLPIHKVGFLKRGVGEMSLPFTFASRIKELVRDTVDVIEVYSPPLPLAMAGWMLKRHYDCPLVVNVQDLFPQNALDLGLVRNGPVFWGLLALERAAYAAADMITVHSVGNRNFLLEKRNLAPAKATVVSNWVDPRAFTRATTTEPGKYRRQFNLGADFVMLFAGVLGPAQGLDVVVDAAWELRSESGLRVLLVGDGTEKTRLVEKVKSRGQQNVQFENFVSKDEYPKLLAECDAGLVSITAEYHTPVVPGKLLGYMAGGIPVLAALNLESDGHSILRDSGAGYSVAGNDVAGLAAAMRRLRDDSSLRSQMGERGRRYAMEHFDRARCIAQYEQLFTTLIERHQ
jgi:glycosyltransferase involved in cell wall biosynthesis